MTTVSIFVMLMASLDPALTTRTAASLAVLLCGAVTLSVVVSLPFQPVVEVLRRRERGI